LLIRKISFSDSAQSLSLGQKENVIENGSDDYMKYLENNNQLAISEGNTTEPYVNKAKSRRQKSFGFSQILWPTVNPCSGTSSINQHLYS
jgi:hypothetical protein